MANSLKKGLRRALKSGNAFFAVDKKHLLFHFHQIFERFKESCRGKRGFLEELQALRRGPQRREIAVDFQIPAEGVKGHL